MAIKEIKPVVELAEVEVFAPKRITVGASPLLASKGFDINSLQGVRSIMVYPARIDEETGKKKSAYIVILFDKGYFKNAGVEIDGDINNEFVLLPLSKKGRLFWSDSDMIKGEDGEVEFKEPKDFVKFLDEDSFIKQRLTKSLKSLMFAIVSTLNPEQEYEEI